MDRAMRVSLLSCVAILTIAWCTLLVASADVCNSENPEVGDYKRTLANWKNDFSTFKALHFPEGVKMSNKFPSPTRCGSPDDILLSAPNEPEPLRAKAREVYLSQSDFAHGTLIITEPGTYTLTQNIIFSPNPDDDWFPRPDQSSKYPGAAALPGGSDKIGPYALGFFAAISVASDDVIVDLGGFSIAQSEVHALQQRFFAVVELGSSPFIPSQGPGNFGDTFVPVRRCKVHNGTLGRSSHHGIHGNMGIDVQLQNLVIRDWEVASIALNGFQRVRIIDVIARMKADIPVMSPYSQIRYVRQFVELTMRQDVLETQANSSRPVALEFSTSHPHRSGERLTGQDILRKLEDVLRPVLEGALAGFPPGWKEDIYENHPDSAFLVNAEGKVDGSPYGVLIGMGGVQVHGVKTPQQSVNRRSSDIFVKNVTVYGLHAKINEVVGLSTLLPDEGGRVTQADYAGAIFVFGDDFGVSDSEGYYKGNALSDAHAYLNAFTPAIKTVSDRIASTEALLTIPEDLVDAWIRQGSKTNMEIVKESDGKFKFACGWDDMRHTIKGLMGMRMEATDRMRVESVVFDEIVNVSPISSHKYCGSHKHTVTSHAESVHEDISPTAFGFLVAASNDLQVRDSYVRNLTSINGDIVAWSTSRTESKKVQLDLSSVFDAMCNAPSAADSSRIFPNKPVVRAYPFEFGFPLDNTNGAGLSFCVDST
ncbi:hypothetical protein CYMTET_44640 [Cymbomonas tetramitiformis]|uniref:Uncharacterized protein n=1 Tax=Cymbomonas tetramitiformis TaxID=36881 RepID=A0AAE0C121_9CHLO|nr:hypothetical protein CYMTET_44640 [Cymbomonas tetramitiformis]|eukprot:gene16538-19642_t